MMVSTKGRYALRVMIDLAQHNSGTFIPLTDIADRQGISEKYLEGIVALLSKNSLLISVRGKGGGYKLNRQPHEYTVADILKATEGSMAPVACLKTGASNCERADICPTLSMWENLNKMINEYFSGITIADLAK